MNYGAFALFCTGIGVMCLLYISHIHRTQGEEEEGAEVSYARELLKFSQLSDTLGLDKEQRLTLLEEWNNYPRLVALNLKLERALKTLCKYE